MPDPFYGTAAWKRLSAACLRRDRICTTQGCNELAVVADHVIPRSQGGPDTLANLVGRCIRCHNRRRGRDEPPIQGCYPDGQPRDRRHWWNSGAANKRAEPSSELPKQVAKEYPCPAGFRRGC